MKNTERDNSAIELWGGIECTINRVGDEYLDQLEFSGHYNREDDIDKIASLGIKAIRYPVLWEKHKPAKDKTIDWRFAEKNLNKLQQYNINPIVGLVHHGSGPRYVNFFDESFEKGLAEYSLQVAEKFPWVEYYTPINEPLTTARFCGLYGLWFPHKKNDLDFLNILISECKATVMAMHAIRSVNPNAKLVQTDDLVKVHSVPSLQYQADFENKRRWLSYDLISGKVTPDHKLWNYIIDAGVDESDLYFFLNNNCVPDIIGLNYYVTSERFLDDNIEEYPAHTHGANNFQSYADVEAVRVNTDDFTGAYSLIKEAWERFKIPVAVTEAHLHCHREEQMRWFYEIWKTALKLKNEGVDIKAVTAWALLGSFAWNKLLTTKDGEYESGVFDVRTGALRATATAHLLRSLSFNKNNFHPLIKTDGWWKRSIRVQYHCDSNKNTSETVVQRTNQPLLILGKTGTLGNGFARVCTHRNIYFKLLGRDEIDITKPEMIKKVIEKYHPWAIINAAGYVRVDEAEKDINTCLKTNGTAPADLAKFCSDYGIQFMTFSSDLVFDGKKMTPYIESDATNPLNVYGCSKLMAEHRVTQYNEKALIIRTSAFFGPWDKYNFISSVLESLQKKQPFTAASDVVISPTYVPDLINASLDLLIDKEHGIWHLANEGEITWADLARDAAKRSGYSRKMINAVPLHNIKFAAKRPHYSVLKTEKGMQLPSLQNALDRYFSEETSIINSMVLKETE